MSLKKLSKITGTITYSWKMYLNIIDSLLKTIVNNLNSKTNTNPYRKEETFDINRQFADKV
jgi:hypothetical protein